MGDFELGRDCCVASKQSNPSVREVRVGLDYFSRLALTPFSAACMGDFELGRDCCVALKQSNPSVREVRVGLDYFLRLALTPFSAVCMGDFGKSLIG